MKYIKNISGVLKNYDGQDILDQEYQLIPSDREAIWANLNNLILDITNGDVLVAKDDTGSNDLIDFNEGINYLKNIPKNVEVDESGREITRTAATIKGWHYYALFFEIETSTGNLICKDYQGNDISTSEFVYLRYDINGNITTDQNATVKSIITWLPNYDYEIVSGNINQMAKASQDVRLYVIGGLFNEAANYTPISAAPFVQNMNLAYFEENRTDGRASKYMKYTTEGAPFPTNRFQYIFEHSAGFVHKVLISVEVFTP